MKNSIHKYTPGYNDKKVCKSGEYMNNKDKGKIGEEIALKYLQGKGIKIIKTNYRIKSGEIDIIAKTKTEIIFVEVKARTNLSFGYPRDSINKTKIGKIINTAKHYLYVNNIYNSKIRFDVVEVYFNDKKINHIENAF